MFNKTIQIISLILLVFIASSTNALGLDAKIIMLGDSITQGGNKNNEYSYRYELFKLLTDNEICFDFVGSRVAPKKKGFVWPRYSGRAFDQDHQSYYGIRTKALYKKLVENKEFIGAPDIALIHVGTNDRKSNALYNDVTKPLKDIFTVLLEINPDMLIYTSTLNQNYGNIEGARTAINKALTWAKNKNLKVFPVNHNKDWVERPNLPTSHTLDWVHPNIAGQNKMAKIWYQEMSKQYEFNSQCKI